MTSELDRLHARMCRVFTAPARLEILNCLREGERRVGELAALTGLNQPNVSQHLALMREKGIVAVRREGNQNYYRVTDPRLFAAFDLIREMLLERLEHQGSLAAALTSEGGRAPEATPPEGAAAGPEGAAASAPEAVA